MATKVTYVSDLSGVEVDSLDKVSFTYNGESFRLEVSPSERAEFEAAIDGYVKAGRALKAERSASPVDVGDDPRAIRASLRAHGHTVSDKGRISDELMAKYAEIKSTEKAAA